MFALTDTAIDAARLRERLTQAPDCGAFASFEGWVRNHNGGRAVTHLIYSSYAELAQKQGEDIIAEAKRRFAIREAVCVHRHGTLAIGDMAVWVGVTAGHRDAAFAACRFIIDTVKAEVPIWKQEFYSGGAEAAWLANPESAGG